MDGRGPARVILGPVRRLKIPFVLFGLTLVVGTVAWVFQPRAHAVEVAAEVVAASVLDGRGSAGVQLTGDLHPDSRAEVRALEGPEALTQARGRLEVALIQATNEAQEGPLCVILSAIARRQHDTEAAASYGRRGAQLLPTNGSAHHVFAYAITEQMRDGGMLSALKNIGVWRDELRLAIELDGDNVDARREEIFFYGFLPGFLGGDPERALDLVTELEWVNLRMGRALRATLLGLMKREEEALELCRTTLAAEPDDAEMHNALGGLLERSDERAEADEAYAAAMGGEPSRSYYYALYQRAQLRTGGRQYRAPSGRSGDELKIWGAEEALEFLDEYLADAPRAELMPSRADAHWRRGVALESLRRAGEARAAYETAASLAPEHEQAKQALARLATGATGLVDFPTDPTDESR